MECQTDEIEVEQCMQETQTQQIECLDAETATVSVKLDVNVGELFDFHCQLPFRMPRVKLITQNMQSSTCRPSLWMQTMQRHRLKLLKLRILESKHRNLSSKFELFKLKIWLVVISHGLFGTVRSRDTRHRRNSIGLGLGSM